jgi:hypothetical protein
MLLETKITPLKLLLVLRELLHNCCILQNSIKLLIIPQGTRKGPHLNKKEEVLLRWEHMLEVEHVSIIAHKQLFKPRLEALSAKMQSLLTSILYLHQSAE